MSGKQLDRRDLELNALLEITQAINNNLSENDLYKIYKFTLLADLDVARLGMYVFDDEWKCPVFHGTEKDLSNWPLPDIFKDLKGPIQLLKDDFQGFDQAFPVIFQDKLLAVVFIKLGWSNQDTAFIETLSNILIVAIENKKWVRHSLAGEAYRKELEIAKKVQHLLFPKSLPHTKRLEMEASYLPHHDVGGDYYDYLPLTTDKFIFCIADVSGKGVPAALLMSHFQASLRALVRKTTELSEIIIELNQVLYENMNGENFITFFIGLYDYTARQLQYINCGHERMFLFIDNEMLSLKIGTTVLGAFDPLPFLNLGTIKDLTHFNFFGYTDGVTETYNEQEGQFGSDRLAFILKSSDFSDLKKLHSDILESLDGFRKGRQMSDDITMISCKVSQ
ncbi:MAG: PP2C family protein-serine/threonine phosphatase [Flammeovirgaceae bacterium]|jgi:phosphoserine phosphatase RsbU/P|nr:PP2C family protein-serine/threonine phosphatase [Flammeovirgaceae bacterium]|tara:strand:+ start:6928 stop:8106 length:1179 start_codon:yes stop_codon:yes gene_type:complete